VITKLRNAYYGWYLLIAAVVGMAIASGVSFWVLGYYVTPLEEEFGWSRTLLQTGISVSLLVSGLASPLAGKVVDRWGPRRSIILGTIFTCGSYVLLATTSTMVEWYLYFSINSFFRGFMFYIPFQVLISRWFDRKRGRAVGIMAMGFSLGGFLSPVMQQIIDNIGWDASFIFAAIILAVIFLPLGLFIVRDHPQDMGLEVDGDREPVGRGTGQPRIFSGLTVKQAMRTWNFWVIALAFATFFFAMFGWMFNGTPVYESMGISRETISIILVLQALGGLVSRPTFGLLAERIPSIELASVGLATIMSLGMFILLILHDSNLTLSIVLFLCCWMIGSAGGPVLEPLILPKTFGLAHFGAIMGTLFMFETIGQFLVPTVGGAIYEFTGAYDLLLVVNIGCLALSMVFFGLAHAIPNPRIPSPSLRFVRPLVANLVARTEPQHQFANGAQAASANGAAGRQPSGSAVETGTRPRG
jgi:MFS family permease